MIQISHLTKYSYDGIYPILKNLSLNIEKNDSLCIIGMSNAGKSLLLKIMGLIISNYEEGDLLFYNENIKNLKAFKLNELRQKIGFVFQNYTLFDSLTIGENIEFPLKLYSKLSSAEIQEKVKQLLHKLNLSSIEQQYPYQLSGGMNKRVSIARSVIYNPEIIFLDEPTAGLDPINSNNVTMFIKKLMEDYPITLISISNDIHYIRKISKNIAFLYNGAIQEIVNLDEFYTQKSLFIKQFLKGSTKGPITMSVKL